MKIWDFLYLSINRKGQKEYTGFWKHLGCTLVAIVGLVFLGLRIVIILRMFFKFDF